MAASKLVNSNVTKKVPKVLVVDTIDNMHGTGAKSIGTSVTKRRGKTNSISHKGPTFRSMKLRKARKQTLKRGKSLKFS